MYFNLVIYVTLEKDFLLIRIFINIQTFCSAYVCARSLQSCLTVVTPWTVAHQAPLSMGFSRQEYWSGLPCLPLGDLPDPGIKPASLSSPALAGRFFTISATYEAMWLRKKEDFLVIWIFINSQTFCNNSIKMKGVSVCILALYFSCII